MIGVFAFHFGYEAPIIHRAGLNIALKDTQISAPKLFDLTLLISDKYKI